MEHSTLGRNYSADANEEGYRAKLKVSEHRTSYDEPEAPWCWYVFKDGKVIDRGSAVNAHYAKAAARFSFCNHAGCHTDVDIAWNED